MKKLYLSILSLVFVGAVSAQIENPIKWVYTAKKVADKTYDIYITATLENKWHIYAQDAGEGPESTSLSFLKNPLVSLDGKVKEQGKMEKEYNEQFKSVLKFYSNKVSFVQRVRLKSAVGTVVNASISYMICNDKKCLPPTTQQFKIKI